MIADEHDANDEDDIRRQRKLVEDDEEWRKNRYSDVPSAPTHAANQIFKASYEAFHH